MNMTLVSLASGFAGLWGSLPESRTKIICYMVSETLPPLLPNPGYKEEKFKEKRELERRL